MFDGPEIADLLVRLRFTHVVWIPDSALGPWEEALSSSNRLRLVRVCREGETWPLAAGLFIGGARPLVMMQTTGLFESGDALRNVLFDLKLPICSLIGARSWLLPDSPDTAKRFARPILDAWGLDYVIVEKADDKPLAESHWRRCLEEMKPGVVLVAEGRM